MKKLNSKLKFELMYIYCKGRITNMWSQIWTNDFTIKPNSYKLCIFSVTNLKNITPSCYINCTMNYFSIEHSWLLNVSGPMNDTQMLIGWISIINLVYNYFKLYLGEDFFFSFFLLFWRAFLLRHTIKTTDLHITPKWRVLFYKSI